MNHQHTFDESNWPFANSNNSTVYSTRNVVKFGYPILTVAHDHEGDWQFLCGETNDPDDMSIVCFGCIFELHPFIEQFKDLPQGWLAWRDGEDAPWQTEAMATE